MAHNKPTNHVASRRSSNCRSLRSEFSMLLGDPYGQMQEPTIQAYCLISIPYSNRPFPRHVANGEIELKSLAAID